MHFFRDWSAWHEYSELHVHIWRVYDGGKLLVSIGRNQPEINAYAKRFPKNQ